MNENSPLWKSLVAARKRSGAGIGPPKPMPEDVKRKIQEEIDRMQKQKTSAADSEKDTVSAKKGGKVGSVSRRADGIAQRGKTRGRMV